MTLSIRYNYVRSRRLEGTLPGGPGVGNWMITYNRTQFGWGRVSEFLYPDLPLDEGYFNPAPPDVDASAKRGRIHHYQRVRNSDEARRIARRNPDFLDLARNGKPTPRPGEALDLKAAFEYTIQFVEAPMGVVADPKPGSPILGTHSVPIVGISEPRRSFTFVNSWGASWGANGVGSMPYDFFDRFLVESYAIDERAPALPEGGGVVEVQWDEPDPLGNRLYAVEVYDAARDERIGWSFAVLRDGFFDVEELYVRPDFRRRGYGSRLAAMIQERSRSLGVPIRAWIPFADADAGNRPAVAAIVGKLGLGVRRSGVRWAAYKATLDEPRSVAFPVVRIPDRPAAAAEAGGSLRGVETLRGSVLKYDDPFAPALPAEDWEATR